MSKRIIFIRVSLSFLIVCFGFLSVSSRAYAYTAEDGFYPIDVSANVHIMDYDYNILHTFQSVEPNSDNVYLLHNPALINVREINFRLNESFIFPYNSQFYDYYFIGCLYVNALAKEVDSTYFPRNFFVGGFDYNSQSNFYYDDYDTNVYSIDSIYGVGFGFSSRVDFADYNNIGIHVFGFDDDKDRVGNKPANLMGEFGILAFPKGTSESDINQRILNKLSEMQESITDSIGSAADQVTGSIDSASNSITSKLQESFDSLTSNLTDWFDDVFNGYSGSGTDNASTNFDNSATNLHAAETQLTQITNTSVNNYTDFAFDTTVLTSLGASLVYVVTWFTNFWNIGGLYTALLNIGLALLVAFFILRLKGK